MGPYDHRVHAGNAGDVWKHFLLLEAADCLLTPDSSLVYAESHVGRPKYALKPSGDWESGIGRIWSALPLLKDFPYFDILMELNSSESLPLLQIECYPGSALLVAKLAKRKKSDLRMQIWDIDPSVHAAWTEYLDDSTISFHLKDGFAGARSILKSSSPGLLLIDPPFIYPGDKRAAEELFLAARESGWTVLCWHMNYSVPEKLHLQNEIHPEQSPFTCRSSSSDQFTELLFQFSRIGLEYADATGCVIRAASRDTALIDRISERAGVFINIMNKFVQSNCIDSK